MTATQRVLVAYASADGSTAEIAHRIAGELRGAGHEVQCRPAGDDLDVGRVDALVLGSAVHNMAWLALAVNLLRRAAGSSGRPVWCFSVRGLNPRGWIGRRMAAGEARRIERLFPAGLAVREHRVFGGVVRPAGVPLAGRLFYRLVGSGPGDHRDWAGIDDWAAGIAAQLGDRTAPTPVSQETSPDAPRKPT